jgi:hypothetical protein
MMKQLILLIVLIASHIPVFGAGCCPCLSKTPKTHPTPATPTQQAPSPYQSPEVSKKALSSDGLNLTQAKIAIIRRQLFGDDGAFTHYEKITDLNERVDFFITFFVYNREPPEEFVSKENLLAMRHLVTQEFKNHAEWPTLEIRMSDRWKKLFGMQKTTAMHRS